MPHTRQYLQVGFRKQPGHMFGVVGRDGAVSIAMPHPDRTLDGAVVRSRRRTHESPVLDRSVWAVSGGLGKAIDRGLANVGIAVKHAIDGREFFVELTRKTFWRRVFDHPADEGRGPAGKSRRGHSCSGHALTMTRILRWSDAADDAYEGQPLWKRQGTGNRMGPPAE